MGHFVSNLRSFTENICGLWPANVSCDQRLQHWVGVGVTKSLFSGPVKDILHPEDAGNCLLCYISIAK